MGIEQELLKIKKQIENAENKLREAQAEAKVIKSQIKEYFDVGPEELPRIADKIAEEIKKLEDEIEEKFTVFKEKYGNVIKI